MIAAVAESEYCEDQHWKQKCVQSSDDRGASDLRVAHDLGDAERCKGYASNDFGWYIVPVEWEYTLKYGEMTARFLRFFGHSCQCSLLYIG